jgi:hypothetical protein
LIALAIEGRRRKAMPHAPNRARFLFGIEVFREQATYVARASDQRRAVP